jgi:HEAT repeat protein
VPHDNTPETGSDPSSDSPRPAQPLDALVTDPSPDEVGTSALRQFLGLFVVPLLVVVLCVGVFIGFGWIAYEKKATSDYIDDLQSSWGPRRRQAAYELSKILVTQPDALRTEPGAAAEVRRLFREGEDKQLRQYLALVLGHTRDPQALPLLVEALDDDDSQTRIYAAWALGSIGDPGALEPLAGALKDPDAGIRKTAAYALGALGDPAAIPRLEPLLVDATADVRWNAAVALARLGSDAGVEVLEQMLDRRLMAQVPDIKPDQQEEAMIEAIPALAKVRGEQALPLLARLEKDDPSLKVRQAAIEARKAVSPAGTRQ